MGIFYILYNIGVRSDHRVKNTGHVRQSHRDLQRVSVGGRASFITYDLD